MMIRFPDSFPTHKHRDIKVVERSHEVKSREPHVGVPRKTYYLYTETYFYDGLYQSFFCTSDGDELVEDISWSRKKRGPTLAELLRRVEVTGFVCQL